MAELAKKKEGEVVLTKAKQKAALKKQKAERKAKEAEAKEAEKATMSNPSKVAEKPSPRANLAPLEPGLAYFEYPDGRIVTGEAHKPTLWVTDLHGPNKGGFIHKMR